MTCTPVYSQIDSLQTQQVELTSADTTLYLGFLIDQESVAIYRNDVGMNREWWSFDAPSGALTVSIPENSVGEWRTFTVSYRTPALEIGRVFRRRVFSEVSDSTLSDSAETENVRREIRSGDDLFGESNLNQSGSLTRGFTVGNRQDLALDSGLKLDLNGNITDDITIQASLTDRSTPIQPDGATQNIREFDRVFIELNAPIGQLQLGDIDISYDESRFARINRRVQGAVGDADTPYGRFGGGASVSRGQFRTQSFDGLEGVQGPYRLSGAENESFIIVIAGSEQVFVNGSRVNRGAENEYIIDYGLGEITFTNNLVVTDETRIVVEFQYITQNFTRTLFTARGREVGMFDGKFSIGATYIREADNKNPNTQLNLADEDIAQLRGLGNDVDDLFVSGADSVGFQEDADFTLYAKVDTTLNGETLEIFKSLPGNPQSVFRVRFTNQGVGQGSYRRVGGAVNGILYEWVGPGAGRYEPVIRLQAPVSHQILSLDSRLKFNQYVSLQAEWAISEYDPNRFSSLGNMNNTDMALNGLLELSEIETGIGTLQAGAEQTYTGQKFEFFDRPREIEFDRRWNIVRAVDSAEEELQTTGFVNLTGESGSALWINGGRLSREHFKGYRGEISASLQEQSLPAISTLTSYVESRDGRLEQVGTWIRHRGDATKTISFGGVELIPGINWDTEKRLQRSFSDSLLSQSLQFYEVNPGLQMNIGSLTLNGGIGYRANQRPLNNSLTDESVSRSQRFGMQYRPSAQFSTSNRIQFRQKRTNDQFLGESLSPESKGVLMSSVTSYNIFDGDLNGELFYETNTERRALLQETYIEVGPELGQYIWLDLNGDDVQQVDEFFPEVTPNEGTYIRQFIPSDELLPVIDVTFRMRNDIMLGELIGKLSGRDSGSFEYLTWNSLFEIRETSRQENLSKVYFLNPSVLRDEESSVNGQRIIRQRLSWRTDNRDTELSIAFNETKSLTQRAVGVQSGSNRVFQAEGEHQLTQPLRFLVSVQQSETVNRNSRFESRNYSISGLDIRPGISLFLSRSAQIEWRTGYSLKKSESGAGNATARTLSVENRAQLFIFDRIQNRLRLQLRNTNVSGDVAGQAEYELTEGIGRGTNVVWSLNSDYRASSLLRISLQYNGRTTSESKIIQTLRLVVSAVF